MKIKTGVESARSQASDRPRGGKRYPSDLTDARWALISPLLPSPPVSGRGRPVIHPRRRVVEAILYLVRTGCGWRYLPVDFPPWQTVYWYFAAWAADGTLDRVHEA